MSPIESIVYMLWRGIAIGVLISAPMGPVGILCIQRTLDKGRHAGLYTGIGAAISDLLYCLLTGFGLSFIEDFIESNQNVIQLIGSVVLIAFSIYLFRKDPASPHRHSVAENVSARKNILGGFLFTFSNPLIIFLIIGLFARFNFTLPEINGAYYAVGYLGIVVGALGWWYVITYGVDKVRSRFTMRSMKALNIIIGVVILIFAAVGIVSSIMGLTSADAQARRTIPPAISYILPATEDTLFRADAGRLPAVIPLAPLYGAPEWEVDFKLAVTGGPTAWCIAAGGRSPGDTTLTLTYTIAETPDGPLSSRPAITCDASLQGGIFVSSEGLPFTSKGDRSMTPEGSAPLYEGMDLPRGFNHYRILRHGDYVAMLGGRADPRLIAEAQPEGALRADSLYLVLPPKTTVKMRDLRISFPHRPEDETSGLTRADISGRKKAAAGTPEGIWRLLDWSVDTSKATTGGDYTLGVAPREDGCLDIIYLDGARVNGRRWREGMVKGTLFPTGIPGIYDLRWRDADGAPMERGLRAEYDSEAGTLTLMFPAMDVSLRFVRL
ncbi:MAG: LysE family translocator [Bacteroides sp.]|nr:LysE family translocator [Bacteroides sp.]